MPVDLHDVVPAVHAAALLDEMRGVSSRLPPGSRFYREALADGLVVVYVEDGGRDARILLDEDVAGLGLEEDALRARAVENLRRRLKTVEQLGGPDVRMISAGGTYEASLLLVDDFWRPETLRVDGDYVVAVPSCDVLMVTGSGYPLGIARLRQLAREGMEKSKYPITAELLVRRDGEWSVLPAWTSTRPAARFRSGLLGRLLRLLRAKNPGDG